MNKYVCFYFIVFILILNCRKNYSASTDIPIDDLNLSKTKIPHFKRNYWPTEKWKVKNLEDVNISKEKLQKMEKYACLNTSSQPKIHTDSLLIIKDGYLVYEKYNNGYNKDRKHLLWSVSKSFVNALVGMAILDNKLTLKDQAYKYYPMLSNTKEKKQITIQHLLEQSTGLFWEEKYEYAPLQSTVINMLYTVGSNNMGEYTASFDTDNQPGYVYEYSSGNSNLLMAILHKIYTDNSNNFPWDLLFEPLGIKDVTFEQDGANQFVASSYIYMKPRDLAKFAFLYLNNGQWEDQHLFTKDWVSYTSRIKKSFYYAHNAINKKQKSFIHTAHWYIHKPYSKKNTSKSLMNIPYDVLAAQGHWGQYMFIIPDLDLIIIRTGNDREETAFNKEKFLNLIIKSVIIK